MTLRRFAILASGLALVLRLTPAQETRPTARAAERAAKLKELSSQLQVSNQEDAIRYTPEFRDKLTGQARELLRMQVQETLDESGGDADALLRALKLMAPSPPSEYTGASNVFRTLIWGVPVAITGFELDRGGAGAPETKVFMQAYRKGLTGWALTAETGDDFDSYRLNVKQLTSPRFGEVWFLAYGDLTGYNGHKIRLRIYAFDGEKFTTVWSPPDRLDATVTVAGDTFKVHRIDEKQHYELREVPFFRTDEYLLTASGVVQLSSTPETD
jgi:hypothetical protein